jgi:hypothetical protein
MFLEGILPTPQPHHPHPEVISILVGGHFRFVFRFEFWPFVVRAFVGATGRAPCPLCLFGRAQDTPQKTPNPNNLTLCPNSAPHWHGL